MASALEQFVNSVRQLSAQGEALGRPAGRGDGPASPAAGGPRGGLAGAALRPGRAPEDSVSSPLARSGSVAPSRRAVRSAAGPSGPGAPRTRLLPSRTPRAGPLHPGA